MYICKNCGNSEKFIGYVQEKGKALIYQHNNSDGSDTKNDLTSNGLKSGSDLTSYGLNTVADLTNQPKSNEVYTELISENLSWAYFLSDKDWKSSLKLKKCYYCHSSDISQL